MVGMVGYGVAWLGCRSHLERADQEQERQGTDDHLYLYRTALVKHLNILGMSHAIKTDICIQTDKHAFVQIRYFCSLQRATKTHLGLPP